MASKNKNSKAATLMHNTPKLLTHRDNEQERIAKAKKIAQKDVSLMPRPISKKQQPSISVHKTNLSGRNPKSHPTSKKFPNSKSSFVATASNPKSRRPKLLDSINAKWFGWEIVFLTVLVIIILLLPFIAYAFVINSGDSGANQIFVWERNADGLEIWDKDRYDEYIQTNTGGEILAFVREQQDTIRVVGRTRGYDVLEVNPESGDVIFTSYDSRYIEDCTVQTASSRADVQIVDTQLEYSGPIEDITIQFQQVADPLVLSDARECLEEYNSFADFLAGNQSEIVVQAGEAVPHGRFVIQETPVIDQLPEGMSIGSVEICGDSDLLDCQTSSNYEVMKLYQLTNPNETQFSITGRFELIQTDAIGSMDSIAMMQIPFSVIIRSIESVNGATSQSVKSEAVSIAGDSSKDTDDSSVVYLSNDETECKSDDVNSVRMICLINEFRANNGVTQLNEQAVLSQVAQSHSQWMSINTSLSHVGQGGSSYLDRCVQADTVCTQEIIARGPFSSSFKCVDAWTRSPEHAAALLDSQYTRLGVGLEGGFCTALFD